MKPCDLRVDDPAQCPGDTVCADVPGPTDEHCANPDWSRKGFCPAQWRCDVEGRCFEDADCGEDVACTDRQCAVPAEPDAAPPVEAIEDAGVAPDASVEPDAEVEADAAPDDESAGKRGGDCSTAPGAPTGPWWLALAALGLSRRRRR